LGIARITPGKTAACSSPNEGPVRRQIEFGGSPLSPRG
jgi:hypothetical protein